MSQPQASHASGDWAQDGGADAAAALLRRYDPTADRWRLPRRGEFWDAVALAHGLGRFGAGRTIAVVDDGFDMALPALARHTLVPQVSDPQPFTHGTAVALLILAVAPQARLRLYPVRSSAGWDAQAIAGALQAIVQTDAAIVNLSLGQAHAQGPLNRFATFFAAQPPWPDMTQDDVPYWLFEGLGAPARQGTWRGLLRAPSGPLAESVSALTRGGRTVVAAAGNARGHVYDPALRPGVFAVGFQRVTREAGAGMEVATLQPPDYSQSEFNDYCLQQPAGVLGSSFATPLVCGFVALMDDRADLAAYAELAWRCGMAEQLMARPEQRSGAPTPRQVHAVAQLFAGAERAVPHMHTPSSTACPECALFAVSSFVNGGLYQLRLGDLDTAQRLLATAWAVAPTNPHAAAGLALVHASQAEVQADPASKVRALGQAAHLMAQACALRPAHAPYRTRLAEFTRAAGDPTGWTLAP